MDDVLVLAPPHGSLRRAVRVLHRVLASLGLTVAAATMERCVARVTRLYEQERGRPRAWELRTREDGVAGSGTGVEVSEGDARTPEDRHSPCSTDSRMSISFASAFMVVRLLARYCVVALRLGMMVFRNTSLSSSTNGTRQT